MMGRAMRTGAEIKARAKGRKVKERNGLWITPTGAPWSRVWQEGVEQIPPIQNLENTTSKKSSLIHQALQDRVRRPRSRDQECL